MGSSRTVLHPLLCDEKPMTLAPCQKILATPLSQNLGLAAAYPDSMAACSGNGNMAIPTIRRDVATELKGLFLKTC